jgi:hypothetical protein
MTTLGAYRDALVLIGGWAPYLILRKFGEPGDFARGDFDPRDFATGFAHVGSIDIDFVVDPAAIDADQYATIVELLLTRGYGAITGSKFQFQKMIASQRTGKPQSSVSTFSRRSPYRDVLIAIERFNAISTHARWPAPRWLSHTGSGTSSTRSYPMAHGHMYASRSQTLWPAWR